MASGKGFDSHEVMISSLRDTLLLAESDYLARRTRVLRVFYAHVQRVLCA